MQVTLLRLLQDGKTALTPIKVNPLFADDNQWAIGFFFNGVPHIIPYWQQYESFKECQDTLRLLAIPDWQLESIKCVLPE